MNRRQVLVRASMLPWLSACSPTRRAPDVALPATFCGAGRLSGSDATALAAPHWHLKAQPTSLRLREDASDTSAWGYRAVGGERAHPSGGATHPGPLLRARQGELLAVAVENGLPQPTTVHWHGLRLHNAMDGVPTLTQAPIAPGERYGYRIACRDAGTFWYHPHYATHEQLVRGLAGPLIVDEPEVPEVDSELVWMLADWLVDGEEQLREDFEDLRDISHAGRIGNRITINGLPAMFRDGRDPQPIPLAAGARVRLRLINAASARIFALRFSADAPLDIAVAAFDGMPCPLHRPQDDTVHLAPAQRVDLFITMPDGRLVVDDVQEPSRTVRLRELKAQGPSRSAASGWMRPLPANPWQRPRLQGARELQMVLEGGARGRLTQALVAGRLMSASEMAERYNLAWAVNGQAVREHDHEPLVTLDCGQTLLIRIRNQTQWAHPIHLHGFHFQVLAVDASAPRVQTVRDTITVAPMSSADIAFVADNPGDWMFHCHVVQHQVGGMMGTIRVV